MSAATDDDPLADWPFPLDPQRNWIVSAFGRKGEGKSTFNRQIYVGWPGDKLCIDVNGDAEPGADAEIIRSPETRFPERKDPNIPRNIHYRADPGSDTYLDDLDRAVGMALYPQNHKVLVWLGEVGEFTTGSRTGPNTRRLLQQSRHYNTSALFDGPRPIDVNPLVIAQADLVAIYDLPNPADRIRIAQYIGFNPADFSESLDAAVARGKYNYLLWATEAQTLFSCPPIPIN